MQQQKLDLNQFVTLKELMDLLGYKDERSVKKWCEKNNIALFELGKNKYVQLSCLENIVSIKINSVGHRAPSDNATPNSGAKRNTYKPDNEIIAKYLKKYESNCKASKKTSS